MALLILKEIRCGACDTPTLHRDSNLRQITQLLESENEDGAWINFACPQCKHLQRLSVPDTSHPCPEEDESKVVGDVDDYAISLPCAKTDCSFHVWLLASKPTDKDDQWLTGQILGTWVQADAQCHAGYPPQKPRGIRIWGKMPLTDLPPIEVKK